jgi:hypothetical protein
MASGGDRSVKNSTKKSSDNKKTEMLYNLEALKKEVD